MLQPFCERKGQVFSGFSAILSITLGKKGLSLTAEKVYLSKNSSELIPSCLFIRIMS
jgi:hypothetical protein